MKIFLPAVALFVAVGAFAFAVEVPPDQSVPEHKILEQLVGEWETVSTAEFEPGKPMVVCQGTEETRRVGKLWTVGEGKATANGVEMATRLTLGYDPELKKYVGTWIDSMTPYLWKYEGTLDSTGKILTLETEGPNHDAWQACAFSRGHRVQEPHRARHGLGV
jgi:hypothetical protein